MHQRAMSIEMRSRMIKSAVRLLPAVAPAIASVLFASGSAHAQQAPRSHAATWEESGEASWYGGRHNGRRTSSGTVFNENDLTAAHATLPLGTKVRVTMQETGQSVVVTITDRQPPKYVRVIDLSKGAATRIGLLSRGTAMVTLQPARTEETEEVAEAPTGTGYTGTLDEPMVTGVVPRRRGPSRSRHGARGLTAGHALGHGPAVIRVRRSIQHRAAPHKL
jgi:rare lipoprotein A (peptidoglycan hydrolase)